MIAVIRPSHPHGTVAAPFSKSDAQRKLLCAALARGESAVRGVEPSEDMLAAVDCLRALGAGIDLAGETARVTGFDAMGGGGPAVLPCRESAAMLRFLVPVALLADRRVTFTGSPALFARPLSVYEEICRERGFSYALDGASLTVRGRLAAGEYALPGDLSSQFVSGLLFSLPLAAGDSVIRLAPPVESMPYIRMTMDCLRRFGVETAFRDDGAIAVPGGQTYRPRACAVEGDWSNAAFLEALGLWGGGVRVTGLDEASLQGDRAFRGHFAALRAGAPTIDLADCPDLGPVCMAVAALCNGARFTGTRRLRLKESDRCAAMAAELAKCGVRCEIGGNSVTVSGGARTPDGPLRGWGDHRVVMSLAVLAARTGGVIEGAEAVAKSFPAFFDRLAALHVEMGMR